MKTNCLLHLSFLGVFVAINFLNCSNDDGEVITDPPVISYTQQDVSTYGGNDGSIDITVTGGSSPYVYQWSNSAETEDIFNLTAGTYTVTVIDAVDQVAIDSITITEPHPDSVILQFTITHPLAAGSHDGAIDLTVTGGVLPYTYIWSNGSGEEDIADLAAGTYSVTVTDQLSTNKTDSVLLIDETLEDIDGNLYSIIKIGDQYWMQENLRVTHSPEGTSITSYAYNDDLENVSTYGRLYDWNAIMNGSIAENAQGICPCGWHIPSDSDWKTLEIYLGMIPTEADMENTWRGSLVGTKLKVGGESGYEALLSGRRSDGGFYSLLEQFEYMWTSTEYGLYAWRRCLDINSDEIGRWNTFPKTYAFSVRCIKDE